MSKSKSNAKLKKNKASEHPSSTKTSCNSEVQQQPPTVTVSRTTTSVVRVEVTPLDVKHQEESKRQHPLEPMHATDSNTSTTPSNASDDSATSAASPQGLVQFASSIIDLDAAQFIKCGSRRQKWTVDDCERSYSIAFAASPKLAREFLTASSSVAENRLAPLTAVDHKEPSFFAAKGVIPLQNRKAARFTPSSVGSSSLVVADNTMEACCSTRGMLGKVADDNTAAITPSNLESCTTSNEPTSPPLPLRTSLVFRRRSIKNKALAVEKVANSAATRPAHATTPSSNISALSSTTSSNSSSGDKTDAVPDCDDDASVVIISTPVRMLRKTEKIYIDINDDSRSDITTINNIDDFNCDDAESGGDGDGTGDDDADKQCNISIATDDVDINDTEFDAAVFQDAIDEADIENIAAAADTDDADKVSVLATLRLPIPESSDSSFLSCIDDINGINETSDAAAVEATDSSPAAVNSVAATIEPNASNSNLLNDVADDDDDEIDLSKNVFNEALFNQYYSLICTGEPKFNAKAAAKAAAARAASAPKRGKKNVRKQKTDPGGDKVDNKPSRALCHDWLLRHRAATCKVKDSA